MRQSREGEVKITKVVVVEAGTNYTERLEVFESELTSVAEAIAEVEDMGYVVLPNSKGGQNEVCSDANGEYISVTVDPEAYAVDIYQIIATEDDDGYTTSDHSVDWPLVDAIYGATAKLAEAEAERTYSRDNHCFYGVRKNN